MIGICVESARFNTTSQRLADQARIISKIGWVSDLVKLEIYVNSNGEGYQQDLSIRIESLNTKIKSNTKNQNFADLQHHITNVNTRMKNKCSLVVCLFGFYGISTFAGYLMPNPFLYK